MFRTSYFYLFSVSFWFLVFQFVASKLKWKYSTSYCFHLDHSLLVVFSYPCNYSYFLINLPKQVITIGQFILFVALELNLSQEYAEQL